MEKTFFMVACKKFFGLSLGQSLYDFSKEVKKLTEKDRIELAPLLSVELGENVSPILSNV